MRRWFTALYVMFWVVGAAAVTPGTSQSVVNGETQYLGFQVFTASPDLRMPFPAEPLLDAPPSGADLDAFTAELIARVGLTGTSARRLAIIFGPLAFDQSDAQVATLIDAAFDIALGRDVAVGFHLDDSMFWGRRLDLLADDRNVERSDWDGPLSTGRLLAWGPQPSRAPPQMCVNSLVIEAEVQRRGALVGTTISAGLDRLRKAGREELFAGVIVGWETQIGQDFDTGHVLGYCALVNRGLQSGASDAAVDRARVDAVEHFIAIWAAAVASAGVPSSRIYSHVAFTPRRQFGLPGQTEALTYDQRTNFSPAETAFGADRRAGFSTYPAPGLLEEIYDQTQRFGGAPWASAEGANVALGGDPTASGMSTETYLARLFNHGAVLVNIFGWGIGDADNGFRRAAENPEALSAYRKFLGGEVLVEGPVAESILERLPAKLGRVREGLPAWIQLHGGQDRAQPHLEALQSALAANELSRAEAEADALLALMAGERTACIAQSHRWTGSVGARPTVSARSVAPQRLN